MSTAIPRTTGFSATPTRPACSMTGTSLSTTGPPGTAVFRGSTNTISSLAKLEIVFVEPRNTAVPGGPVVEREVPVIEQAGRVGVAEKPVVLGIAVDIEGDDLRPPRVLHHRPVARHRGGPAHPGFDGPVFTHDALQQSAVQLPLPLRVAAVVVGVADQQYFREQLPDPVPLGDVARVVGGEDRGTVQGLVHPIEIPVRRHARVLHIVEKHDVELGDVAEENVVVALGDPSRP